MKRSYELLIAEAIKEHGMMTDISQGINHINGGGYSAIDSFSMGESGKSTIVTVVFNSSSMAVFRILHSDEKVELMLKSKEL